MPNTDSQQELVLRDLGISLVICIYEAAAAYVELLREIWKNFILILHVSSSLNEAQLKRVDCQQDAKRSLLNTWTIEHGCHMSKNS